MPAWPSTWSCRSSICGTGQCGFAAEHVARAVQDYLSGPDCQGCADSRALVLMASRAMDAIGETGEARRFWLHGTGLVRPSEWEVVAGDTMWVLDLKQISVFDDAPLELFFFTGLGIIVDTLCEVWDGTGGRGALGLRHVCRTAAELLGTASDHSRVRALSDEIRGHCLDRLGRQGRRRGWQEVPQVLNLDA